MSAANSQTAKIPVYVYRVVRVVRETYEVPMDGPIEKTENLYPYLGYPFPTEIISETVQQVKP